MCVCVSGGVVARATVQQRPHCFLGAVQREECGKELWESYTSAHSLSDNYKICRVEERVVGGGGVG